MKLRVFNSSHATVVSPDVAIIDTARDPFNLVAKQFRNVSDCGLWLNPFRGNPQAFGSFHVDIVYVDDCFRILDCIEDFPSAVRSIAEDKAASALVYPRSTIKSAKIHSGDQLRFSNAVTGILWASETLGFYDDQPELEDQDRKPHTTRKGTGSTTPRPPSVALREVIESLRTAAVPESETSAETSFLKRISRWLLGEKEDSRRTRRHAVAGLVAYFWTGGAPQAFEVANVSMQGFYLLTEERWMPGTKILVTLQRIGEESNSPESRITVPSTVIRFGQDGVGFEFVHSVAMDVRTGVLVPSTDKTRAGLERFLQRFIQ